MTKLLGNRQLYLAAQLHVVMYITCCR